MLLLRERHYVDTPIKEGMKDLDEYLVGYNPYSVDQPKKWRQYGIAKSKNLLIIWVWGTRGITVIVKGDTSRNLGRDCSLFTLPLYSRERYESPAMSKYQDWLDSIILVWQPI